MRLTPEFERTLRRYVLGEVDEDLRVELEELLVTDPEAFEALGVVEDELVEEYLDGDGTPSERRGFEQRFLSTPEGQGRLSLSRALKDRASALARSPVAEGLPDRTAEGPPAGRVSAWLERLGGWLGPPRWQPAWVGVAAVLALSLIGNAWLVSRPSLPRQSAPNFVLEAGLLRASGTLARVTVPPEAPVVHLRLELPEGGYPLYRAVLLDPDGGEIWSVSRLRAEGGPSRPSVVLAVPAELLPRGDYLLKLSGLRPGAEPESLATYPFRVAAP